MAPAEDALLQDPIGQDVVLLRQLLKLSSIISRPMALGVASHFQVSTNELRVMMAIGGEGPLAGHDISERMAIPPMNVSRALALLAERGWTERVSDPGNRRRRPVQLSEKGWAAYRAMTPDIGAVADHVLGRLSKAERTSFDAILTKLIDQVEGWQPPG